MVRVVAFGVVGVHGVRHVGGDAEGAGEGPVEVLGAAAARGDGPAEHPLQQGALGARLGAAADLFVVEGGEHRDVGGRPGGGGGGDQRGDARVHGDLVVQTR